MNEAQSEISGLYGRRIPITKITTGTASSPTVLMLPGAGYTCDRPLLYFISDLFSQLQYDVIQFRTDYTKQDRFWELHNGNRRKEITDWVISEANIISQWILNEWSGRSLVLVGKSIGTLAMTAMVEPLQPTRCLWLTPALRERSEFLRRIPNSSPVIIGNKDPFFAEAQPFLPTHTHIVSEADHSLEVPGDCAR